MAGIHRHILSLPHTLCHLQRLGSKFQANIPEWDYTNNVQLGLPEAPIRPQNMSKSKARSRASTPKTTAEPKTEKAKAKLLRKENRSKANEPRVEADHSFHLQRINLSLAVKQLLSRLSPSLARLTILSVSVARRAVL